MSSIKRFYGILKTLTVYYAKPFQHRAMKRLYGRFMGADGVAFDIGAHVGNRVRAWRALGTRVVAVEPQSSCLSILNRLYGRDAAVRIVPRACGTAPGTATLHVCETAPTLSSLSESWISTITRTESFQGMSWERDEVVSVTTLDNLIAEHGVPDFVKVDVEGYEAEVLGGLSRAIPALSFEFLPASMSVAVDCVDRLEELGGYRYNYSVAETMSLAEARWLTPEEMKEVLGRLAAGVSSGDVYAQLVPRPL